MLFCALLHLITKVAEGTLGLPRFARARRVGEQHPDPPIRLRGAERARTGGLGRRHRRRVAFLPRPAQARRRNAPAALRSRLSGSRAARGDAVDGDTGGGRVRKWGRDGRERPWGSRGARRRRGREAPGPRGSRRGAPVPVETMAEEEGDGPGSNAPAAARGPGGERRGHEGPRGLGSGRRAAGAARGGRESAGRQRRAEVCGEIQEEQSEWPKVLPAEVGREVEPKVGNRVGREEAVCGGVVEREDLSR